MFRSISRRGFLGSVPAVPFLISGQPSQPSAPPPLWAGFPANEPDAAKEIVGVSHGNLARVKELVSARPALARASWDFGYGDWETPIDAASHVGNRPIAEFLIASGARPTIFTAVDDGPAVDREGLGGGHSRRAADARAARTDDGGACEGRGAAAAAVS